MVKNGAVMEEKQGYERPGYFLTDNSTVCVQPYDWYGSYGHTLNKDSTYAKLLEGDYKYSFSDHHDLVKSEFLFIANANL